MLHLDIRSDPHDFRIAHPGTPVPLAVWMAALDGYENVKIVCILGLKLILGDNA